MEKRDGRKSLQARRWLVLHILIFLCPLCLSAAEHNCRFWGIVAEHAPGTAIREQLLSGPNSLENLSYSNADGWAVGYYVDTAAACIVERSQTAAFLDPHFDTVVASLVSETPSIAVAHIRNCSSGLCNIPNPHPFEREKAGRHWLMGHNGTIDKNVLLNLIRPEYLAANPPQYGADQDEWIDTDLYFILILQSLEDNGYNIKPALGEVIQGLRNNLPGPIKQLNFFLTDGASLWAYREGNTLFYVYEIGDTTYSAIASQCPSSASEDWVAMDDGQLVTLSPSAPPVVENIEDYFDPAAVDGDAADPLSRPGHIVLGQNTPNPFNSSTMIEYSVPSRSSVEIAVYDILGRKIRTLIDEIKSAGRYVAYWDGAGPDGRACASGIYFYSLRGTGYSETRKMLLIK